MSTQTESRILLTVLISPMLVLAFYWLFSGVPIWGGLVLIAVVLVYFWIWRVHEPAKKHS